MCNPQSGRREHVHEAPAICRKPWPNSLQVHLIKVTVINFTALNRTDRHPEPDWTVLCQANIPGLHDYHVNNPKVCGSSIIKVIVLQIMEQTLSSLLLYSPSLHPSIIIVCLTSASQLWPHQGGVVFFLLLFWSPWKPSLVVGWCGFSQKLASLSLASNQSFSQLLIEPSAPEGGRGGMSVSIPVMRKQPCRGQSGSGRPDRSPGPVMDRTAACCC